MNIKNKLITGAVLLATIPVLIGSIAIGWEALEASKKALEKQAENQLVAVRDLTAESVTTYFGTTRKQVLSFSNAQMIIEATEQFTAAFNNHVDAGFGADDDARDSVAGYYRNKFGTKYRATNISNSISSDQLLKALDKESMALQYAYISNNPFPLGEKDSLKSDESGSQYDKVHKKYHSHIRDYLKNFGYYDIFLVDHKSGDIVYSVYKELDYTTSLIDGPYANSSIGEAFRRANAGNNTNTVALTDFSPYTPSYGAPASFIASPIFNDDGEKVGILIFQMPIDSINAVLTHNNDWEHAGLGKSGETYLIGSDFTMRSQSRFMIEDKPAYLRLMESIGLDKDTVNQLRDQNTSINLQPVKTAGTKAALKGSTGYTIFPDYRGVNVLSAYMPLTIEGLQWVLMSEIDEEEAFRPIADLKDVIIYWLVIICASVLVVSTAVGIWFANQTIKPVNQTVGMLKDIAQGGGDLTQRLDESRKDELGELAQWFNLFVGNLQAMVSELNLTVSQLASSSEQLASISNETRVNIDEQHSQTEQAATAMTEMSSAVQEVAKNAAEAAGTANEAQAISSNGQVVIHSCTTTIGHLAKEIEKAEEVISLLHKDSAEVGGVLAVIEGIAEQTNLLALNAAIEAARAGETGRGFAVVADEVRTLAQRTQESTQLIQSIIDRLQKGATNAVDAMARSKESSVDSMSKAEQADGSFNQIAGAIDEINSNSIQIASASEEQHATTEEVSRNVTLISSVSERNHQNVVMIAEASGELSELSEKIRGMLAAYKT